MGGYAWVTLATNDAYSLGALVLAHSLRQVGTKYDLACLVTPGVTATMREKLAAVFSLVQEVNVLDSKDEANLALLARPELGITFTKLHCWRLTQYEKCVFVDADAFVVRNCDELFEREELSAAPDVGWPDCFNSGVFVFRPSQQTFASITAFAAAKGSFDGGDQGLLNMYFSDWASKDISKHLPFIYNMCSTATYSYLPAFKQFGEDVRIIHFIGITKPWLQYFDSLTGIVQPPPGIGHLQPLLQLWWNIFCERVHPQLSISMASSTLAPIWHAFASPSYVPPNPAISVHSDATNNDVYSRAPDFSEFKDPWEEYSPQNDSFPSNDNARCDKSDNCHCAPAPQHNQQPHHEHQHHSSYTSAPYNQQQYTRDKQHWEQHAPSHSGENYNQGHSAQHTEHQHWHEQHQWNEQRHHHEQHQHHEQRHDEQRHCNEQRQHSEHHQHSDTHRNNAADYHAQHQPVYGHYDNEHQSYSADVKHEVHNTQHYANGSDQASHQDANYQNYSQSSHVTDNESQHCHRCHEEIGEQSLKAANQQTDTRRIDSYPLPPAPCTDLHNVATRSDPNVTEHLDDANAGLAGALAQLTLGEARSAEQVALEEHMRKQSWEQGHIDYMGRDSFDNIWKKICETLSFAQKREPTPPQENVPQAAAEPAVTAAPVEADKPAVEANKDPTQSLVCKVPDETLSVAQIPETKTSSSERGTTVETAATKVSSEPEQPAAQEDVCAKRTTDSKDVIPCETSTEVPLPKPPVESLPVESPPVESPPVESPPVESPPAKTIEQCQLSSPQTTQETPFQGESLLLATKEPQQVDLQTSACLLADAVCKKEDTSVARTDSASTPTGSVKSETPTSATQDTTQPTAASISADSPQSVVVPPVTSQARPIEDAAKRAVDVTQPLTIDPSERHAEVLLAASEVSTVSPVPIQVAESVLQAEPKESVSGAAVNVSDQAISTTVTAVHESTDVAPTATTAEYVQLNGSVCEAERPGDVVAAFSSLPEKTDTPAEPTKEPPSDSAMTRDTPSEKPSAEVEKLMEPTKTEAKPAEQIAKAETAGVKPPEQLAKAEATMTMETIAKQPETVEEASSKVPESPVAEQSPPKEKPTETKASNIPSTPTVIEATPPTSPSAESAQETEEKIAKKSLKKSDSADGADSEGADKKATKKTVKKVVKKPKAKPEEAASSPTSADGAVADGSQSKTKKTVKVVKKTATKTLETDTSVPETPPPPSSASADAPVPPKRKTKSSTANAKGTTAKKSEAEE